MNKVLVYILLGLGIWMLFFRSDEVVMSEGIKVSSSPLQQKLASAQAFRFKEYRVTPLARFELEAKVLSRENYHLGREADLSPTDLALGWGRMSDEKVLKAIDISQSGRWYRWQTSHFPIPRREIETHSANMHIIPKDEAVASRLADIRQGEIIRLKGKLVRVDADDGWRWVSSLSRDDTGSGACEVFFTESIERVPVVP